MMLRDPWPFFEPWPRRAGGDGAIRVKENEVLTSCQVMLGEQDLLVLADAWVVAHAEHHNVVGLAKASQRPLARDSCVGDVKDNFVTLLELGQLRNGAKKSVKE